jgi:hypothetical protein
MWKSLHPGDKVLKGDTIRFRSSTLHLTPSPDKVYDVVKTDQHYFEIVVRADKEGSDEPERKIVKYMDVGYHIRLEVWSGDAPFSPETKKEQTDMFGFGA